MQPTILLVIIVITAIAISVSVLASYIATTTSFFPSYPQFSTLNAGGHSVFTIDAFIPSNETLTRVVVVPGGSIS
jgi:hypothetical protein